MWQTIPNFSRYEISTNGEVRHRRHQRILKGSKPYNGYLQVGVHSDILKRCLSKCIHQLMALAFMGEKPPGYEVAHKDNIKTHNELSNLKYIHWRKNRIARTIHRRPCKNCRKETKGIYCSRECQWIGVRKLITCAYCGIWFFRKKRELEVRTRERGYTNEQTLCSYRCSGLLKKGKSRPNKPKANFSDAMRT